MPVHGVSTEAAGARSGDEPARSRQKGAQTAQRDARKARPGNLNAWTHGAYLNARKHDAKVARDRHKRHAERTWRAILVEQGRTKDSLAAEIAGEAAFSKGVRLRIEAHLDSRGYFTKDGQLKPAVAKALEVSAGLIDRCARLIDQLQDRSGGIDWARGDVVFSVVSGCTCEAGRDWSRKHLNSDGDPGVSPRAPVAATSAPGATTPEDEHRDTDAKRSRPAAPPAPQREAPVKPSPPNEDPFGMGWRPIGEFR